MIIKVNKDKEKQYFRCKSMTLQLEDKVDNTQIKVSTI
jgi:hypothetical protein